MKRAGEYRVTNPPRVSLLSDAKDGADAPGYRTSTRGVLIQPWRPRVTGSWPRPGYDAPRAESAIRATSSSGRAIAVRSAVEKAAMASATWLAPKRLGRCANSQAKPDSDSIMSTSSSESSVPRSMITGSIVRPAFKTRRCREAGLSCAQTGKTGPPSGESCVARRMSSSGTRPNASNRRIVPCVSAANAAKEIPACGRSRAGSSSKRSMAAW